MMNEKIKHFTDRVKKVKSTEQKAGGKAQRPVFFIKEL